LIGLKNCSLMQMTTIQAISHDDYIQFRDEELTEHILALNKIVQECTNSFEGNIFYLSGRFDYYPLFISKQRDLYTLAQMSTNILEIGMNSGLSSLLMLVANKTAKVIAFDIAVHEYTEPCAEYLRTHFPSRFRFIKGNSANALPLFRDSKTNGGERFDLVHIDGNHTYSAANLDFFNSRSVSIPGKTLIVLDDTSTFPHLALLWRGYIDHGFVSNITMDDDDHSIGRVLTV